MLCGIAQIGELIYEKNLIINKKQKRSKKILELFITIAGWGYIIVFTIQVIISILLWVVGIHYLRYFILSNTYYSTTIDLVIFTIACALIVLSIVTYWSYYNKFKYGKLQRRTIPRDVTIVELSEIFSVSEEFIHDIQNKKWIEFDGELESLHEINFMHVSTIKEKTT
ncbi:poly-beta-1,6-N-acetyl-D-glucosamine biosynthesis protein PgaD [Sulfoacidibacillus ferrooxidans]|uniref:Poly-beta-1,6-N-acetyl-D-glucosamine biosynthesis protein PgaD n=1 Tax=Sulfoacidibacillus ferrooxidans TaxID=2005001 RepID=A0A9X2AFY8_9BACL|nr:poly-beta-1,6-N-acetyl-D-glucosamine biosynthesis protein PgaD [Sulfoacidibacillus ferrooxidans]MCI0184932.1 hypothetical protein [Sulfoacidibacillus ferrooxidans]